MANEEEEEADVFDSASPAFAGGYPSRLMLASDGFVVGIPLCWFQGTHAASTYNNTDSSTDIIVSILLYMHIQI